MKLNKLGLGLESISREQINLKKVQSAKVQSEIPLYNYDSHFADTFKAFKICFKVLRLYISSSYIYTTYVNDIAGNLYCMYEYEHN